MKRLIAMTCVLVMLMVFAGNVFALDVVDNEYDILESAAHEEIERLYSLRGQLCFNYEENVDTIKIIDEQLVLLGVVELTETEALGIMGIDAEPLVSLPSESTMSFVAEEKYIYVKYRGALDAGNQVLCYAGNKVQYEAVYAVPTVLMSSDGSYVPHVETEIITGVQQSDNYDSALGYAVTNFFYKIHLDEDPFIVYMIIQSFTVTGLEEVTEFRTPRSKCALV